jgi:YYY domain-containing protein
MILASVFWFVAFLALGWAVLPLAMRVFAGLPDRGFGLCRVLGLIVVGWLAYLTAMLGFTQYVGSTVLVIVVLVAAACWGAWWRDTVPLLRARCRLLAAEEAAFLAVFGAATVVRAFNADMVGQEKFMDYAFLNALLRTTTLPATDMWLSGYAMPYYYLGYLLVGLPGKIAHSPGPLAYSFAMVLVFASGFAIALSLVYALVASTDCATADGTRVSPAAYVFGLLAGTLTMVVGNLVGPLELIAARGWGSAQFWAAVAVKGLGPAESPTWLPADGGWWWRSSRVIANIQPDGITEFPYFSFILGDLHPHYTAIPFGLLIVGLAVSRWLDAEPLPDLAFLGVAGLAMATLIPASTWDVPSFWGLLAVTLLADAWRRSATRAQWLARLPALALPIVLATVLAVPYFVGYQSQNLGLAFVEDRTPAVSMLILFGPALLVAMAFAYWLASRPAGKDADALVRAGRMSVVIGILLVGLSTVGQPTIALLLAVLVGIGIAVSPHLAARFLADGVPAAALFVALLFSWALCILLGVETVYLRDVFGSRMNTVFKFHYHVWLMVGVAGAAALGIIWRTSLPIPTWRLVVAAIALTILIPGLAYPLAATWTKSNGFRGEPTLMGDRFLERGAPADHRAIEWLRENAEGRPVVVEAVGGSYTEHTRVSTFSGLPTLIGWVGHEQQWRGDSPEYGPRQQAVDVIYRSDNRDEVLRLLRQYDVRYVFFGSLERAKYGDEAQARLDRMLTAVYSRGGTTIYAVGSQ